MLKAFHYFEGKFPREMLLMGTNNTFQGLFYDMVVTNDRTANNLKIDAMPNMYFSASISGK